MGTKKPIFILGVGAQKTGTTWLHAQLAKSPMIDFGFKKEYHVWDAVFKDIHKFPRSDRDTSERPNQTLLRLMQRNEGVYETYFRDLIRDEISMTGDLTPSYSMLNSKAFTEIKMRLEKAGFSVKVLFIMRDPVARVWSAYQMVQRAQTKDGSANTIKDFDTYMRHPTTMARTRYDHTVRELRASFNSDELFIGFYETLFEQETQKKLAEFLQIDAGNFDSQQRINASTAQSMPATDFKSCREVYADVYKFCNKEFPETKKLWAKLSLLTRMKRAAQSLLRGPENDV